MVLFEETVPIYTTQACLLWLIWINITKIQSATISMNVDCITQSGTDPSNIFNTYYSNAACPASYTMTGCGAEPVNIGSNDDFMGVYMVYDSFNANDDVCHAISNIPQCCGSNGGIRAFARCCNSTIIPRSSVRFIQGSKSSTGDGDTSSVTCTNNEELIGCTGYADNTDYDGSYSGNQILVVTKISDTYNKCSASNGFDGNGATASGRCLDTTIINNEYNISCITVWGDTSAQYNGFGTYPTSKVSCPTTDFFMTSCTGYSPWISVGSYNINNQNECVVTHTVTGDTYAMANAVCCRILKPTNNPTVNPTAVPTADPIVNPTINPTHYPSLYPSINPTMYPSTNPTIYPSINPTISSSIIPASIPTTNPSNDPTQDPTIYPTIHPTNIPITDPTIDPTTDPMMHSTIAPTQRPSLSSTMRPNVDRNGNIAPSIAPTDNEELDTTKNRKTGKTQTLDITDYMLIVVLWMLLIILCIICLLIRRCIKRKRAKKATLVIEKGNNNDTSIKAKKKQQQTEVTLEMSKNRGCSDDELLSNVSNVMRMNGSIDLIDDGTQTLPMSQKDTNSGNIENVMEDEFIIGADDDIQTITNGDNRDTLGFEEDITGSDDQNNTIEGNSEDSDNVDHILMDDEIIIEGDDNVVMNTGHITGAYIG